MYMLLNFFVFTISFMTDLSYIMVRGSDKLSQATCQSHNIMILKKWCIFVSTNFNRTAI